jgi:hypothetical protein
MQISTGVKIARTKHINVCDHNSRDLHAHHMVDYFYVYTNDNVADILMMVLTKENHIKFTKGMRLW